VVGASRFRGLLSHAFLVRRGNGLSHGLFGEVGAKADGPRPDFYGEACPQGIALQRMFFVPVDRGHGLMRYAFRRLIALWGRFYPVGSGTPLSPE